MNQLRIFIIGSSLPSQGLRSLLKHNPGYKVLGSARTADEALTQLAGKPIDVLIVIDAGDLGSARICPLLMQYPGLPVLNADIRQNSINLITTQRIKAEPEKLMDLLAVLPRHSQGGAGVQLSTGEGE